MVHIQSCGNKSTKLEGNFIRENCNAVMIQASFKENPNVILLLPYLGLTHWPQINLL